MAISLIQPNSEFLHRAEPTEFARTIVCFKELIRRDRGSAGDNDGRYKQKACAELAYIYHMCDYQSDYSSESPEERHKTLAVDIFDDPKWEPDDLIKKCMDKYTQLTKTPSSKLLEAANHAVLQLETYFRNVNFDSKTSEGAPIYSAKDVIANLEKLSKLVENMVNLRKQVDRERKGSEDIYGGMDLNEFNA